MTVPNLKYDFEKNAALVGIIPRATSSKEEALMLFSNTPINPDIVSIDEDFYQSLTIKLLHSRHAEQLIAASANWDNLSIKEKSLVIRDHLEFVYLALGRKKPLLNLNWDKGNSYEKEVKDSTGRTLWRETINLLEPRCFEFSYFIKTLHHEIAHARQEYFIEGDPLHPAAIVFRTNLNHTISPLHYNLYRASPIEKHAQSAEQHALILLKSISCSEAAPAIPNSKRIIRHKDMGCR